MWIQMFNLGDKGLTYLELGKLFFYLGVGVVKMVLPLTILLSAIMTFGNLGERYELSALKSAGISLWRVMQPLLATSTVLAFVLFLFSNYVIPDFQKKAKNMLYNILVSKPALNFTPGEFIGTIPGMMIKFEKIEGEKGEKLTGIIIHKNVGSYENQQTVFAQRGLLLPATNRNYLKLQLFKGQVIEDNIIGKDYQVRRRQENQVIKFDTLVYHIDVSELLRKGIESQSITDHYQFDTFWSLNTTLHKTREENLKNYRAVMNEMVGMSNSYLQTVDSTKVVPNLPFDLKKLPKDKRLKVLTLAQQRIETIRQVYETKLELINGMIEHESRMIMWQQRIVAFSVSCLFFFMIGASLGSIIRKGGVGLPVVMAVIIFVLFFLMNVTVENLSWAGRLDPYLASWIPNIVLFALGTWLTINALRDSPLLDIEKYKALILPIWYRFFPKKEHQRYQ